MACTRSRLDKAHLLYIGPNAGVAEPQDNGQYVHDEANDIGQDTGDGDLEAVKRIPLGKEQPK